MNRAYLRLLRVQQGERIDQALEKQQFVHPHRSVKEALSAASVETGFCPGAGERAMQWLDVDGSRKIGKLKRTELLQLARCIHRFWRQNAAAATSV